MKHYRFWFLVSLVGLLCIGWLLLCDTPERRVLGSSLLAVPALLLTLRDCLRAWRKRRVP